MSKVLDLQEKFEEFFYENEGFSLRAERFYDDYEYSFKSGAPNPAIMVKWLQAAFYAGARTMAQDTLDTLGDYATAVAGVNHVQYTSEQAFDTARKNLMTYYTQLFDEVET
jgi:hypothetical protein